MHHRRTWSDQMSRGSNPGFGKGVLACSRQPPDQSFLVCPLTSDPTAKRAGAPEVACALAPRRTCCRGGTSLWLIWRSLHAHRTGQVRQVAGELGDVSPDADTAVGLNRWAPRLLGQRQDRAVCTAPVMVNPTEKRRSGHVARAGRVGGPARPWWRGRRRRRPGSGRRSGARRGSALPPGR